MSYEHTRIWKTAFDPQPGDRFSAQRTFLRVAYEGFWKNGCELARQIAKDLPNLTLHDERHFNALWLRADQILGDSEALNPLEAFILGGAILLHDAANTVAAYPGGLATIKASPEWQDEIAIRRQDLLDNGWSEEDEIPADIRATALLSTLRNLHAARAEKLADLEFANTATGRSVHLLESDSLRNHLGRTLGLVAASHHWDIQDLPQRLPRMLGTPDGFPTEWAPRPIRVACLLRCADAVQLDQSRAPDFLYALLELQGLSETHWRAQNRLLAPIVDPDDPEALVFTSSREFGPGDTEAWWVAYDAINIANRELQNSFSLLRDLRQSPFSVRRVRDAEAPERLVGHVTVGGWKPVSAEVRISNVAHVVKMFGADELYGSDYLVPIRELLQNAADAIRRRREVPSETGYDGSVIVRLRQATGEIRTIEIEDDGFGMSEGALTTSLIDFGSSYLGSALARSERPGMVARCGRRIGKYGIGFFSVFMISDRVSVVSKPFDKASADFKTLSFRNGFSLRPILLECSSSDISARISTRVTLEVAESTLQEACAVRTHWRELLEIPFRSAVSLCCPMLDCDVYYVEEGGDPELIHKRRWFDPDARCALESALLIRERLDGQAKADFEDAFPRMQFIDISDPSLGFAAINTGHSYLGLATVSGLKPTHRYHDTTYENEFVGFIDHEPRGPQRGSDQCRNPAAVSTWASEQALRLAQVDEVTPSALTTAAVRVADFKGDPSPLIRLNLNRQVVDLAEVVSSLGKEAAYFPITTAGDPEDRDYLISHLEIGPEETSYIPKDGELEFVLPVLEPVGDRYSNIGECYHLRSYEGGFPEFGILDCIRRALLQQELDLVVETIEDLHLATYVGAPSERDGLEVGAEIMGTALKVTVAPRCAAPSSIEGNGTSTSCP